VGKEGIVNTGYKPREHQGLLHRALKRFNVLVCHRRFGKTVFTANEKIDRATRCPHKNPQFAYIAPTYGQAKRVAWDYFKEYTKDFPGVKPNEAELRIDIPRPQGDSMRIMLLGAENPGNLRGIYLDGATLDEYAEMDITIWAEVIRPALSDRLGWATFIGTPKGQNHFYDIYNQARILAAKPDSDWYTAMYKASETGILLPTELAAARATMTQEQYDQEFECSFSAALIGAYYGKEMSAAETDGRITTVRHDPNFPVDCFWDLGIDDSTAIWFRQTVGREYRWIHYYENSGEGIPFYAELINEYKASKRWNFRDVVWPHDGAVRDFGTGVKRTETFRNLTGIHPLVLKRGNPLDGIHGCRVAIGKSVFDLENCSRGIDALKNYQRKWDGKNKIYQQKPMHNWASHGADAFRTAAMHSSPSMVGIDKRRLPREAEGEYNVFGRG